MGEFDSTEFLNCKMHCITMKESVNFINARVEANSFTQHVVDAQ